MFNFSFESQETPISVKKIKCKGKQIIIEYYFNPKEMEKVIEVNQLKPKLKYQVPIYPNLELNGIDVAGNMFKPEMTIKNKEDKLLVKIIFPNEKTKEEFRYNFVNPQLMARENKVKTEIQTIDGKTCYRQENIILKKYENAEATVNYYFDPDNTKCELKSFSEKKLKDLKISLPILKDKERYVVLRRMASDVCMFFKIKDEGVKYDSYNTLFNEVSKKGEKVMEISVYHYDACNAIRDSIIK